MDFTGIQDAGLQDRAYNTLAKYADIWSEKLSQLAATVHHITVKPNTVPAHLIPHGRVAKMREIRQRYIEEHLKAGIIEPENREGARLVVLAPKKDSKLWLFIDYCSSNQPTIAASYSRARPDAWIDGLDNA